MLLRRESCCTLTFCAFKLYALYFRRFLHAENFYRRVSSHLNAFTRRKPCTQELLGAEAFTHRCVYTYVLTRKQRASPFHRGFGTRVPLHKAPQLLPTNVFAHRSFCAYASTHSTGKRLSTQQLLRKKTLYTHTQMLLHKSIYIRKAPTHGKLYTGGPLQTGFYLQKLLHTGAGTMHGSKKVEAACIWYICFGQALRIE